MKTVRSYFYLPDAHLDQSYLQSEGLVVFIKSENSSAAVYGLSDKGIELQVAEEDFEKALEILDRNKTTDAADSQANTRRFERAALVILCSSTLICGLSALYQGRGFSGFLGNLPASIVVLGIVYAIYEHSQLKKKP